MVILTTKFSAPVKYGTMNAGKVSAFHPRFKHTYISHASKAYEEARKVFEANRFMKTPVKGWTERFIVIDYPELVLEKLSEEVLQREQNNPPLSFEDFVSQYLKSLEEYSEKYKKYYDDKIIRESYEDYCHGSYDSYLIERERINPGIST